MQALKSPTRRHLIIAAGAASVGGCGTTSSGGGDGPGVANSTNPSCDGLAKGPGLDYCLVEKRELRIPGAAALAVNHVILINLDDGTAALVARDDKGLYALSAICTHACCIVSVCTNGDCSTLETNPGNCAVTQAAPLIGSGGAAFLCPCHGSAFTSAGIPISGPAKTPLPSVSMRVDGADVVVDLSVPVSPATRA